MEKSSAVENNLNLSYVTLKSSGHLVFLISYKEHLCEEYGKLLLVLEPYLTWKQLLDIQLEIIQLEPKAKTL